VDVDGQRFRVRTPQFSTPWLPDTPRQRPLTLVWCRWLGDAHGKPLFTWPALAVIVGRAHRQAASPHLAAVRPWGEDVRAFGRRQRKVEAAVVAGVLHALLPAPLAGPMAWRARGHRRLGRQDLRVATIESALEPIAGVPGLRGRRRQLETGQVHSQEAWLLTAMRESLALPATPPAGWCLPSAERGRRMADPTALAALVTPDLPLAQGPGSLGWLTCLLTLCSGHVPLSVVGRWGGVHQTTLRRWV
jgi:hypothetical protein